jgi:hypothetical protein
LWSKNNNKNKECEMKAYFNHCMLGVLVLAGVGYGTAQSPAPGGFHRGGNMDFMAREMGSKVVTGAPFTAQAVTQTTQTLPNGTHISRNLTATLYRDSQGRTRREEAVGGAGPLASNGGAARQMVFIHDPVAATVYELNPQNKTAHKMAFNPGHGPRGRQSASEDATASVAPGAGRPQRFGGTVKTESLGTQVIDGLTVEGTRHTMTIPAGAAGNDQAIESVSERWYSPDLQVVVKSVHTDPRFGQTTYQLTNIQRAEPSATLFQVPSDYAVTTGGRGAAK